MDLDILFSSLWIEVLFMAVGTSLDQVGEPAEEELDLSHSAVEP